MKMSTLGCDIPLIVILNFSLDLCGLHGILNKDILHSMTELTMRL